MRYCLFGPRSGAKGEIYNDLAYVESCLITIEDIDVLITGGSRGIEQLAEQFAVNQTIPVERVPPNFHSLFGSTIRNPDTKIDDLPISLRHQIFNARNDEMMQRADRVIVFWDSIFFEVGQIIKKAIMLKKTVIVFPL